MKDPAFLFYPNDFVIGTQFFSDAEVGQYIRILCAMHQHGRLTKEQISGMCHGNAMACIWQKFEVDENGLYYNPRLEEEINKRKKFTENQKVRAKKRWSGISHGTPMASPMAIPNIENENENESVNENKLIVKGKFYKNEDFQNLPDQYIFSTIEQMKIQKNTTVSSDQVCAMWNIFKNQNLSGDKYYNSESEVYRHFCNWIKNQKFEKNGKSTISSVSNERFEQSLEYLTRYTEKGTTRKKN